MVQRCCVPFCDTKVGDLDIKGAKVRFHRIPLTQDKFLKWRDRITNKDEFRPMPDLTTNSRICSKHFHREDYIADESQKTGLAGNHVLAKDAMPSIFHWNSECQLSRAIPYVNKKTLLESCKERTKSQEIQCSLEEEKLKGELSRKNIVIRRLLQRLAELEGPEKDVSIIIMPASPKMPTLRPEAIGQRASPSCSPQPQPPQLQLVPDVQFQVEVDTCTFSCEETVPVPVPLPHPPAPKTSNTMATQTETEDENAIIIATTTTTATVTTSTQTLPQFHQESPRTSVIRRLCDVYKPPKKRKHNFDHFN